MVFDLLPRLRERRKQLAGTLSGGEQQMLAIGRGLMGKPRLQMFDEPSLGLAPILVMEVFNTIKKINSEGTTILIVEQNVKQTLLVASRGYVLETGKDHRAGDRTIPAQQRTRQDRLPGCLITSFPQLFSMETLVTQVIKGRHKTI